MVICHNQMGLSENRVYSQWNSHLIGIMISKTIGFRGINHFQTHPDGIFHHLLQLASRYPPYVSHWGSNTDTSKPTLMASPSNWGRGSHGETVKIGHWVFNEFPKISWLDPWIGLRENLNRKPWFFPVKFPHWLVVEPYPSEKYEFVKWDCCSQYAGKVIQFLFQTTNQLVNWWSKI